MKIELSVLDMLDLPGMERGAVAIHLTKIQCCKPLPSCDQETKDPIKLTFTEFGFDGEMLHDPSYCPLFMGKSAISRLTPLMALE